MNEKDEAKLFPLLLPGTSCMMARDVLMGYVGEHHLNPNLHHSHSTWCSDTGHHITLVKADEGRHCSNRRTLEILPLYDILLPLLCRSSAKPWETDEASTLLQRGCRPPGREGRGEEVSTAAAPCSRTLCRRKLDSTTA